MERTQGRTACERRPQTNRPAQRQPAPILPSTKPSDHAAILFTDIEGFAETTDRLGDAAAHELLMRHNRLVRACLLAHDGREVKTMGDGFLATFASALDALRCAVATQWALDSHNRSGHEMLRVRMGVHAGGIIQTSDDVHGRNVILAARLMALAVGGEVLVSDAVRATTHPTGEFRFGVGRVVQLAGLGKPQAVHAVLWRERHGV